MYGREEGRDGGGEARQGNERRGRVRVRKLVKLLCKCNETDFLN